MPVTAKLNYLRIAPRKVRLVADLIRKKKIEEAQTILNFTKKKGAGPLLKLLKTAIADARHNFQLEQSNLYISKITVDEGPKYKRWRARARGVAFEIQKKTSHITLVLDEVSSAKKVKKTKKIKKKPVVAKALAGKEEKEEKVERPAPKGRGSLNEVERPKLRPETEQPKPKIERGIKRIFRRKAF